MLRAAACWRTSRRRQRAAEADVKALEAKIGEKLEVSAKQVVARRGLPEGA
jgi:hypothetical protein